MWNTAKDRDEDLQRKEGEGEEEGEAGTTVGEGQNSEMADGSKDTKEDDLDSTSKPFIMCLRIMVSSQDSTAW